jgi:site-specific DNA-methyltransferase (adenine-specific)
VAQRSRIITGDCLQVMRSFDADSIDAIVTDPPYGLTFAGEEWDKLGTGQQMQRWAAEWAAEALRVAKPGAYMLSFGGATKWHRAAAGIEDGGWAIYDNLFWFYGQGKPKSIDVGKELDRLAGADREVLGYIVKGKRPGFNGGRYTRQPKGAVPVTGAPVTRAAQEWDGWGTALKPAYEGIVLARKPVQFRIADNLQRYGTGAINVQAARGDTGRWPTNVLIDEQVAQQLGPLARYFYCVKASARERHSDHAGEAIEGNAHVTVKPLALMRWCVRLVAPARGVILDPFGGSGSTGVAAKQEGRTCILIEQEAASATTAKARML